jgi:hypothetical protein
MRDPACRRDSDDARRAPGRSESRGGLRDAVFETLGSPDGPFTLRAPTACAGRSRPEPVNDKADVAAAGAREFSQQLT